MSYVTSAQELAEISESFSDRLDSKFNRFCELLVIKANSAAMHGLREVVIKTCHLRMSPEAILRKLDNRFMFDGCAKSYTTNSYNECKSLTITW